MLNMLQHLFPERSFHDNLDIMGQIHQLRDQPNTNTTYTQITAEELEKEINKIPIGAAIGPDNLHPRVLKKLIFYGNKNTRQYSTIYAKYLSNALLNISVVPLSVSRLLSTCQVVGIPQPNKTRPIGVNNASRKVISKIINKKTAPEDAEYLARNNQFGSSPFGTETLIHMAQLTADLRPSLVTLHSDWKGAFQNVKRTEVLTTIQQRHPTYYEHALCMYGPITANPILTPLDNMQHIIAGEGVIQGGANSSTHYNLTTLPIVTATNTIAKTGMGSARAYADDMTCNSSPEAILQVLDYHSSPEVRDKGLIPNFDKYTCLLPPTVNSNEADNYINLLLAKGLSPQRILRHPDTIVNGSRLEDKQGTFGSEVMGIPVGSAEFLYKALDKIIEDLTSQFDKLKDLRDSQTQLLFVRQCMDATITHLCRGLLPSQSAVLTQAYSALQRRALCNIAGVQSITDLQFDLARCPIDKGGLGLLNADTVAHGAFVASTLATLPHIYTTLPEVTSELTAFLATGAQPTSITLREFISSSAILAEADKTITLQALLELPASKHKHLQRRLNKKFKDNHVSSTITKIQNHPDHRFWRIVQSGATAEAGAWLEAVPDSDGMDMPTANFSNAVRNRLHIPHPYILAGMACNCSSLQQVDQHGIHLQMCRHENKWLICHEHVVADIRSMAQAANLTAQPNNVRVSPDPRVNKRGDLNIIESGHKNIVIDVQITNTCSDPNLERRPGAAAKQSEMRKNTKYASSVKQLGAEFYAFSVEVQGRYGEQALKLFNYLAQQLSSATSTRAHVARKYWARRIACTIQNKVAEVQRFKADRIRTTEFSLAFDSKSHMCQQIETHANGRVGDSNTSYWD